MKHYKNQLYQFDRKIFSGKYGDVEYIVEGEGIPVLIVHGICGGCDQGILMARKLLGNKVKIIAVSRFGYLNSTLPKDNTPRNQAKIYHELLKYLGIEKVVILGASAGGAPALQFAMNYKKNISALLLIGTDAPNEGKINGLTGPPNVLINNFMFWLLVKIKRPLLIMFGIKHKTYNNACDDERNNLNRLLESLLPIHLRKKGIINDKMVTNLDMETNKNQYHFHLIEAKTLILQAKDDPLAKYERVKEMSKQIKTAKFIEYETGGHLLFGHGEEVKKIIQTFIKEEKNEDNRH